MSIRILLVDDHNLVLEGFKSLLTEPDMEIVGEARDGHKAVEIVNKVKVDVVLMDVVMPLLNGVEATRKIIRHNPEVKVIALSMHSNPKLVEEMFLAGASGYLLKTSVLNELVAAVRTVSQGKIYISPDIAGNVVDSFVKHSGSTRKTGLAFLSEREREILQLVAEGKTTKEIAFTLHLTAKTVETHRHNIMNKLDIRTIAGLTKYAVREGLSDLDF
ncbi:MAG: response regulator transcription factor [Planctomycetes bacterium]|nr:response regulator transcription factor [Planctomycetota bacterium]